MEILLLHQKLSILSKQDQMLLYLAMSRILLRRLTRKER